MALARSQNLPLSRYELVRCTCALLTQSGHRSPRSQCYFRTLRCFVLKLGGISAVSGGSHIMSLTIDAYIFSWTGYHTKAATIAKALLEKVSRVTIVYSDQEDEISTGEGRWIRVPNEHFGGKKFERCLAEFHGDIMLLITADAQRDNWSSLVDACDEAFTRNGAIGVWSPSVKYSPWHLKRTSLSVIEGRSLHLVARTDSIVWAISKDTVGRLSQLHYSCNNIRWGIDTIACAYCHAKRRLIGCHRRCERRGVAGRRSC